MNKIKGLWTAMMNLILPPELKAYVQKPGYRVFRKKVEKSKVVQDRLKLEAAIKREKRIQRNMQNKLRGAYTNKIS